MRTARGARLTIFVLLLLLPAASRAQAGDKVAALGRVLFSSTALSSTRSVSCATCHDPAKGFADGKTEAEGEMKITTGRNTPTLIGIGVIPKFRDPRQAMTAKPGRTPRVLNLEDRCLEPLENELEMGSGADAIVSSLKKDTAVAKQFDDAFADGGGVSKARLAKALAAFVRTLGSPKPGADGSPYSRHLAGETDALSPAQARGLGLFKARGCAECHSGPALSDGMMHVVDPPWGQRMLDRQRTASERRIELLKREYAKHKTVEDVTKMTIDAVAREARVRANALPGGGGYDPDQIEVQTATLWDVKRTAPYFRDGSVRSLEDAVRVHVREMRVVRDNEPRIRKELLTLDQAGKRSPTALRSTSKSGATPSEELSQPELQDLVEFLGALSPS
jgi:cytochrome c peroxidase